MLVMSVVLCCAILTGSDEIIHPCLDSFSLVRLQLCILLCLAFEKTQALITFFREALTCSPKGQPISLATFNCRQSYWALKNLFTFQCRAFDLPKGEQPSWRELPSCRPSKVTANRLTPLVGHAAEWARIKVFLMTKRAAGHWLLPARRSFTVYKKRKPIYSANYHGVEDVA